MYAINRIFFRVRIRDPLRGGDAYVRQIDESDECIIDQHQTSAGSAPIALSVSLNDRDV
jgi:hypothetical protein